MSFYTSLRFFYNLPSQYFAFIHTLIPCPFLRYEVESVKGLGNILFGGEGLFLTRLTGPGKVILQTMNMNEFVLRIDSYMPKSTT